MGTRTKTLRALGVLVCGAVVVLLWLQAREVRPQVRSRIEPVRHERQRADPALLPGRNAPGAPAPLLTTTSGVDALGKLAPGQLPFKYDATPLVPPSPSLAYSETGPVERGHERPHRLSARASDCGAVTATGECLQRQPDDDDADGYVKNVDCDDLLAEVHPGAREQRCNQIDEDCDGSDDCPADADGDFSHADVDCDDHDPKRNPLAQEVFCNGVDEDCSGFDACDHDGDNDPAPNDCDDRNPGRNHLASEVACDAVDQNCDGVDCCGQDADGDGFACKEDCDDRNARAYPGAETPRGCYRADLNCDGKTDGTDCH